MKFQDVVAFLKAEQDVHIENETKDRLVVYVCGDGVEIYERNGKVFMHRDDNHSYIEFDHLPFNLDLFKEYIKISKEYSNVISAMTHENQYKKRVKTIA